NPGKYHFVPGTAYSEGLHMRRAHFHGMIHQGIVIRSLIHAETMSLGDLASAPYRLQAGVDAPVRCACAGSDRDLAGLLFPSMDSQKHAGAIEETVSLIQVGAPHRQVPGINAISQGEAL